MSIKEKLSAIVADFKALDVPKAVEEALHCLAEGIEHEIAALRREIDQLKGVPANVPAPATQAAAEPQAAPGGTQQPSMAGEPNAQPAPQTPPPSPADAPKADA